MKIPKTFPGFLDTIQQFEVGEIGDLMRNNAYFNTMMGGYLNHYGRLMPAVYVLDYTQRKYVYASSNVKYFIDHPITKFLDGGLDFGWEIFHKDDLRVYGEQVLYENLKFIREVPLPQHGNYVFTCNYRIRNRQGEYRQVRQQSVFIKSAANGMPLATLGFLYDITPYLRSNKILHAIEAIPDTMGNGRLLLDNVYFPYEQDRLLSAREVEVLKWICEGLSSSQIANKLHVSPYTINAHRRHIIEKTNKKNLIDLLKYAIEQSYL